VLGPRVGLEPLAGLEAIHLGHHHVEQDDVDRRLADVDGLAAGGRRDDVEILRAQPRFEQPHVGRNIVNDQHAGCQ
jgi:hypothetical protein